MSLSESSIVYSDEVPPGVSAETQAALAAFSPRWSRHQGAAHQAAGGYPGCLIDRKHYREAAQALRDDANFKMLIDHTAVDYPDRPERFTVVSVLMNYMTQERILLKTRAAEGDAVPSLAPLWKSADWSERETYDMFGIPFEGHPELTRIYMPQDYDGWPMRRDFPLQGHLRFQD